MIGGMIRVLNYVLFWGDSGVVEMKESLSFQIQFPPTDKGESKAFRWCFFGSIFDVSNCFMWHWCEKIAHIMEHLLCPWNAWAKIQVLASERNLWMLATSESILDAFTSTEKIFRASMPSLPVINDEAIKHSKGSILSIKANAGAICKSLQCMYSLSKLQAFMLC